MGRETGHDEPTRRGGTVPRGSRVAPTMLANRETECMPLRMTDVGAEAILLLGGVRAILLQIANPAVGQGVAEHSDFANRPLDRLRGTLTFLYVTAYGTADEARQVAKHVGRAHAPVRSAPGMSDSYDASDADLQLWVAATIYDTALRVLELTFGPRSAEDAESLLADYAIVGTALGVPRASWPASVADFGDYWAAARSRLEVREPAASVAAALLHPRRPLWLTAAMPLVRTITAGLLDEELRSAYGLRMRPRRFALALWVMRTIYPRLPKRIRHAPVRYYLRRFRAGADHPRA